MGTDKALLEVDGRPMAVHVADALRSGGCELVVLVGASEATADVLGLPTIPDRWPDAGPLAATATALLDVPGGAELVVVAPCDQVGLTPELVAALVRSVRSTTDQVWAARPVTDDGRRHPLPAAWRLLAGPTLRQLVEAGQRRADGGFAAIPTAEVSASTSDLADLDTPDDLRRWRETHPEDG
jgi:molybdopterin-guanine dinucleotide biosynthesis protein A